MRLATPTRAYEPISPLPLACPFFWSIDELAFVDERAFVFPGVLLFLPESAILYLIYKEPIP